MKPLCIDLFAGCFGWSAGWIALGGRVIGFDLEHLPHHGPVPQGAELVLQDVLTLHGSQFKTASLILASPPCQRYSYMAMPWKLAKALIEWHRESPERVKDLNALFDACFRIQLEASKAAGRYIPMVVENVRGAQPWVGRAKWHYGSYYLWADVPALMPFSGVSAKVGSISWNGYGGPNYVAQAFNKTAEKRLRDGKEISQPKGIKNSGGSWFNIGSPGQKKLNRNPVHEGVKLASESGRRTNQGNGVRFTSRDCGIEGVKQHGSGSEWFDNGIASHGSRSSSRKAASAQIAKIPFALSQHIARCFWPVESTAESKVLLRSQA